VGVKRKDLKIRRTWHVPHVTHFEILSLTPTHPASLRMTGGVLGSDPYLRTVTTVVALVAAPVSSVASTFNSAWTPPKRRSSGTSLRGLKR